VRDAKCSVRELFVPFAGNHASARVRIGALSTNLHARVGGVTAAVAAVAAIAATAADAAVAAFAAVAAVAAVAASQGVFAASVDFR
jgi:hypothetical protein